MGIQQYVYGKINFLPNAKDLYGSGKLNSLPNLKVGNFISTKPNKLRPMTAISTPIY